MKRFFLFAILALGIFPSVSAHAKIYYINRGVKYHIGDNHFETSEDKDFLGAYGVVGQEWIQAFQVSQSDKVKVHIEKIWGVDDCPYCKVMVSIDDKDMLRLTQANNGSPIDTLEILAATLQPGMTHYLKIASYGGAKVDDFMIQDVSVETQVAEVKLLEPGPILKQPLDPMPVFKEPEFVAPTTPCQSASPKAGWMPGESQGKTRFEVQSKDRNGVDSGTLGSLAPGQAIEFYMQVDGIPTTHDFVGHAVEFIFQDQSKEGWVLSFREAQGAELHGNMIRNGVYRAEKFTAGNYQASAWNRVRIQSCVDGLVHLSINDKEASLSIPSGLKAQKFMFRTVGARALISKYPQAAPPTDDGMPMLPPGGL